MRAYIIKRLLLAVPTLILVTIIIFLIVRFIPGSVVDLMVAEMSAESGMGQELSPAYIKHQLGMDVPIWEQYGRWASGAIRGDLGHSLWTGRNITTDIINTLPISFELGVIGLFFALIFAVPIGVFSAIRQDTWGDYLGRTISILAISLPGFWVGTMVVVYPSIWWHWSPAMEYIKFVKDPGANLLQFLIPGFIMGMVVSGTIMRMTRTMMLETLRQDYIRTAWAKGLTEKTVVIRHALKNALIPVVTVVGMMVPFLIGGQVVLEQIFVLPGMGRFLLEAITKRDYPIISGINLAMASIVLIVNLFVDVSYAYLDPRIRYR
jgi:peptide/nickel transport system permease protein